MRAIPAAAIRAVSIQIDVLILKSLSVKIKQASVFDAKPVRVCFLNLRLGLRRSYDGYDKTPARNTRTRVSCENSILVYCGFVEDKKQKF